MTMVMASVGAKKICTLFPVGYSKQKTLAANESLPDKDKNDMGYESVM